MATFPLNTARCATLMRRALALAAVGAWLSGCPGPLDRPERFYMDAGGGCSDVETTIFIPSCGGAGCHENPGAASNLDLVSAGVGPRIKAATSTCQSKPMSELILEKVKPSPSCGSVMPLGADLLSADAVKCLEQYLATVTDGGI
jgi:hypothetical protein